MKFKVIVFLFASFFLLNINLGSWGVTETSEARYAEISKEMLESGDFIHPTLMGIAHYHKPPLTYYITTVGYKIFGVSEYGPVYSSFSFRSVQISLKSFKCCFRWKARQSKIQKR